MMKKHVPEMMHAAPMRCDMIFDGRDAAISPGLTIIRHPGIALHSAICTTYRLVNRATTRRWSKCSFTFAGIGKCQIAGGGSEALTYKLSISLLV